MTLRGPATASAGGRAPITLTVANTGSGHDFPTGFPEGRIAWVAVHAVDLGYRRRAADPRFVLEAHLRRRRQPDDARDDRSRVPGLQVEAAGRLGRSVLDPVQGRRVARRRLPDAGPALRRAAEPGDERARAADRRRRARHRRGVEPARAAAVQGPERQRRPLRRLVPARHPPAADAPRGRDRRDRSLRRRDPRRDRRADRGHRRRLLPVGRSDRRQEVPGQHGRRQRQLRPRAVRPGRPLRRPRPAHRAGRRRGRAAGADGRAQLGDRASTARGRTARRRASPATPSPARATSTRTSSPRSHSPSRSAASTRAPSR